MFFPLFYICIYSFFSLIICNIIDVFGCKIKCIKDFLKSVLCLF
nr:MAG TPA: hypothetical protein [Caudoviricetes sp.]DAW04241.1 MAG TPA: hypothetical protein [Caudoviricetes sp.]